MNFIIVCITCHNRRENTLKSINALYSQLVGLQRIHTYLVDDGSTDGTADAVRERYPEVKILPGDGNLYWNRGMHLAFGEALQKDYDYYLWLNDDTVLFPDALQRLLDTSMLFDNNAIIVGSTQDPDSGEWSYGGFVRRHPKRPLRFKPFLPANEPVPVETMNGNCVLIPKRVVQIVGNLDPVFLHAMGDFDYGLRAQKLGFEVILAPGYFGNCKRDKLDFAKLPIFQRIKSLLSKKGLPPRDWAVFAKRYAGVLWPVYWLSPYIHTFIKQS
jgi:GT2 family glycosyltransferase